MSTRIAVLADTHVKHGSKRRLPDTALPLLASADAIWHAGDVLVGELLDELAQYAPVTAVLGNNDRDLVGQLPETAEATIDGVRLAMIHDSGTTKGRERRMRRRFPDADLVIFGHSHAPIDAEGVDGQRLLNPGSPIERRRAPTHTMALVELDAGDVRVEIIDL